MPCMSDSLLCYSKKKKKTTTLVLDYTLFIPQWGKSLITAAECNIHYIIKIERAKTQ